MQAYRDDSSEGSSGDSRGNRTPIETPDFFEEKLPGLRDKLCWTQANMGQFFGVSKITVHCWEKHGAGETEARKAALRLVTECMEVSSAQDRGVGDVLLDAGVVRAVTGALHRSSGIREGALDELIDWKTVFGVRDRLGWTQTEFALFLGITHSVPAVWESPAAWESGENPLGSAIRAALLALDLSSDPDRPYYREPKSGWDDLKTRGLQAFYDEVLELRIDPPR
jgi:DNA-binding XRE family transcriptional regulator